MRLTSKQFAAMGRKRAGLPVERESELHADIIAELKSRRIYYVHSRMDRAATNGIGTTDFIIALPNGRTLWIEAKTAKGKLTSEQSSVALLLSIANHPWACVRSIREFITELEKNL